jgi:hypothetical protein
MFKVLRSVSAYHVMDTLCIAFILEGFVFISLVAMRNCSFGSWTVANLAGMPLPIAAVYGFLPKAAWARTML